MDCFANGHFTVKANMEAKKEDHLPETELIGHMRSVAISNFTIPSLNFHATAR
jgi:hypothetical protein